MIETQLAYDCPPEIGLLDSFKNDNLTWKDIVGELIDNALDAGASQVVLTFGPQKTFAIRDDGLGIENIGNLITVGKHVRQRTTRLGRYGIGFKSAACWLWGRVEITTIHLSKKWYSHIAWQNIVESGRWRFFQSEPIPSNERSGTIFKFVETVKQFPQMEPLIDDLSFIFTPALHDGKQIIFERHNGKRIQCRAYELPLFSKSIKEKFEINGKGIDLDARLIREGEKNFRPGFIYYHGHRVIEYGSLGAKDYSIRNIAATVQLLKGWSLAKNKNTITDTDRSLLEEEIYIRCLPILQEGQNRATTLAVRSLTERIEASLKITLSEKGQEKRKEGNQKGAVMPSNSGKERLRAKEINRQEKGNVIKKAARGGLKLEWMDLPATPNLLAIAEILPTYCKVIFNTLTPYVRRIQKEENDDAIKQLAIWTFSEKVLINKEENRQKRFPFVGNHQQVIDICSTLLAQEEKEISPTKTPLKIIHSKDGAA